MTTSTSFRSNTLMSAIRTTLVVAGMGLTAAASQATVVYDRVTGGQTNYNQCFACTGGNPTITELGDIITLAGTERIVDSVTFNMSQQTFTGPNPYFADITFSIYSVNTATLATSLISAVTNTVQIPSTGVFPLTYNFNNITVPDTIYYGVSVNSLFTDANGLRLGLWDYWSPADFGDGSNNLIGTDVGTVFNGPTSVASTVYGRIAGSSQLRASTNNGLGVNDLNLGFTPNVQISAVPEPETYALMALGLLAVGAVARRRKQA